MVYYLRSYKNLQLRNEFYSKYIISNGQSVTKPIFLYSQHYRLSLKEIKDVPSKNKKSCISKWHYYRQNEIVSSKVWSR